MALLGMVGFAVAEAFFLWLVHGILKIPVVLQTGTLKAFYLLAVSIPIIISAVGLCGVLEAYQIFGLTNVVCICPKSLV